MHKFLRNAKEISKNIYINIYDEKEKNFFKNGFFKQNTIVIKKLYQMNKKNE